MSLLCKKVMNEQRMFQAIADICGSSNPDPKWGSSGWGSRQPKHCLEGIFHPRVTQCPKWDTAASFSLCVSKK